MSLAEYHNPDLETSQSDSLDAEDRFTDVERPIRFQTAAGSSMPLLNAVPVFVTDPRPLSHALIPGQTVF